MMSGELIFLIVTVVVVLIAIAIMQLHKYRYRIRRAVLARIEPVFEAFKRKAAEPEQHVAGGRPPPLTEEEKSRAELDRIQEHIEGKKQVARETDVSYHLWGLYNEHFRSSDPHSLGMFLPDGEWYDVKILNVSSQDGRNEFDFELKGDRYRFVDDEERQGWSDNTKFFSLFLYDGSGRCLIEVPMKVKVHKSGRTYSISSNGPAAFLPGRWVNDFINVKLKHQSKRNREIRAQKHQERLNEIADLKERFGISD